MIQKIFRYCLPIIFLTTGITVHAANSEQETESVISQCEVDLTKEIPDGVDWRNLYRIHDEFGRTWQRAIVGNIGRGTLEVREGETTDLLITGQPNNPIQVFFMSADNDDRPNISVCINAGKGDENGQVHFPLHARFLWPLINRDVVLDAWTLLDEKWNNTSHINSKNNFQMGTYMSAPEFHIQVANLPTRCVARVCNGSPYYLASRILPNQFPNAAKQAFPFPERGPSFLSGNVSNSIADEVLVTKLSPTTYYSMIDTNKADLTLVEDSEKYIDRALTAEILKRILLGDIGNSANHIDEITAENFVNILNSEEGSHVRDLVRYMRDSLLYTDENPLRIEAIKMLEKEMREFFPKNASMYSVPDQSIITDLFPAADEEDSNIKRDDSEEIPTWATQLVQVYQLWTNSVTKNECLLESNFNVDVNFLRAPSMVTQESAPSVGCVSVNVQVSPPRGHDPVVVLPPSNTEIMLSPNFTKSILTRSKQSFQKNTENWILRAGDVPYMSYEYRLEGEKFSSLFPLACISSDDIQSLSKSIQTQFHMPHSAISFLQQELNALVGETKELINISFISPQEVASRIGWKVNDKAIILPQIFFKKNGLCTKKEFQEIDEKIKEFFQNNIHNGYGVGISE